MKIETRLPALKPVPSSYPERSVLHKLIYIGLSWLSLGQLCAQPAVEDAIRRLAIDCSDTTKPNQEMYAALKDYKVICLGEMHGTSEAAEFLTLLATTFVSNKRAVIAGFEIPASDMTEFMKQPDSTGLLKTTFFSKQSTDARSSAAWYKAILACSKAGATLCFYDGANDKAMYDALLGCYKADSTAVILTLSGNVHNKLLPYKGIKTMGCFLKERFGKKVYTINHIYNEGTMYNATTAGLKLRTIPPGNNAFATSVAFERYLMPDIFNNDNGYSGLYYTKVVTASFPKCRVPASPEK